MMQVLSHLEPRKDEPNKIIFNEIDDFTEVIFYLKGCIDVGFNVNNTYYFVLRKNKSQVVADHGCTFNHKSAFIYKTHTVCEGYFIRKQNWHEIMESCAEITDQLKQRIITKYLLQIKLKVKSAKRRIMQKLMQRSDIQQIMALENIDQNLDSKFLTDNVK